MDKPTDKDPDERGEDSGFDAAEKDYGELGSGDGDVVERDDEPETADIVVIGTENGALDKPEMAKFAFEEHLKLKPKAVIVTAAVSGAVPDVIVPHIQDYNEKGIAVFIVATNYGSDKGVQSVEYGTVHQAVEAGAVPLRDANINDQDHILEVLREATDRGVTGNKLKQAMIAEFGTVPEAEEKVATEARLAEIDNQIMDLRSLIESSLPTRGFEAFPEDALRFDLKAKYLLHMINDYAKKGPSISRVLEGSEELTMTAEAEAVIDLSEFNHSLPGIRMFAAKMYEQVMHIDSLEEARERLLAYVQRLRIEAEQRLAELEEEKARLLVPNT